MKLESLALHHGYESEATTKAAAVPIYQTTSYTFDDTQHGADLFDLKVPGNIYTRIMNPTTAVLEARLAEMEGGVGALGVASGMAAITYAIQAICQAGDNIISSSQLYGGTYNLFAHTLPRQGIDVRMASFDDYSKLESLIDDKTRAVFCESIGNPAGNIVDLQKLASIAHQHGVPLIVDNTVATPYLCRAFDHGADIIVHSLTKYIGGHGTTVGGIIIDSGKFDWVANKDRFPMLNEPDPSYHGVVYTEALGPAAFIGRCRVVPLRNTGSALAPHSAFLLLQGLETLGLRMERHCENALQVARHLQQHPKVEWVNYAALPDSPFHATCQKITQGQASGILSFGITGGREAGARFIDALQMILRLVNIGDAKSLACHPATTTHRQLSPDELATAGVSEDLVRLSIGIEHIDDILADIDQALTKA
ncbi:MAG: O-acetylhomoserine aminocarboxypropyltransferase [Pseudomonadales bacterium]|jgi:O-acetylhomoserine (thiol)-lyase|uniref:O-acetylhomoserine aminocarboxypropyltransferase/cysteine synthase family protein n=1 Tax=unclassified Ketobacter TaxID=2639109 RepID=UPI000C68CF7A|nr:MULTISPECIES: aminotransferase class I/II-fold pyridoxal phosphate-dependent enzyme [unclassified Ketobacter]MAA59738.1 O-acetylhomoserine aminocarboxypropyltransferase [Pseudomonadales bacterium]MEC8812176.1 aminotransferase class I/II-fold pyridoxal phosphate-dependent enzyme [Pseudomonadota bacterium]TNC86162.1 MAG: O-acetylhomoserine aminocarboxypropyltransferase [Alcanivorax sp.]HAU14206.1 O-acetylhomoserine aminocarboxypropyltransferase [Gammaproteobacteria bacterium]MAQ25137.1 O-acet|tara:strand:+ start:5949 stop:7220 length:1272 start_codon:yes stop_codon:yes gene_type:complete